MSTPNVVGRWAKVVKNGGTFLIEFHADHTVTEGSPFNSDTWDGKWSHGTTNDEYGEPGLPGVRLEVGGLVTILTENNNGSLTGYETDGERRTLVRLFRLA